MTPKAKELFDKMYIVDDPMGNYPMCFDTAKECALIAVDEILTALDEHQWQNRNVIEFYLCVKQDIINL